MKLRCCKRYLKYATIPTLTEARERIARGSGIQRILAAIEAHPKHAELQRSADSLLWLLACDQGIEPVHCCAAPAASLPPLRSPERCAFDLACFCRLQIRPEGWPWGSRNTSRKLCRRCAPTRTRQVPSFGPACTWCYLPEIQVSALHT